MNSFASTTAAPGEDDGALADLLDDLANQLRAGHDADIDALARAHPEHAEALCRLAPAMRMLAEVHGFDGSDLDADAERDADNGPATVMAVLGDFRILGELGRGGMGIVYAAEQISLGRQVALKVLPLAATLDPRRLQRFQNEARAAGCLHHTNIVPVFAVGAEHGVHFYAMQLIEGQTLAAVIRDLRVQAEARAPAAPDTDTRRRDADTRAVTTGLSTAGGVRSRDYVRSVTRIAMQAAEALDYAHQLGVVHRDIKPGNLMVDARGQLWVTDFGLAQFGQADVGLTLTGDMVGTLRYMSPEQALGQRSVIDHRADVYALGATLYELLTLAPALDGEDRQELLRQIAFEEPLPPRRINPAIPADLETVVLKAMAKSAADRYATAQELADDLRRFLEDKAIRARRPSRLERARKWARRHRSVVWSVALALLATLAVLAASVGWILRDQAARDAKVRDDVQQALAEAQAFQIQGKGAQAWVAALRAKALLQLGPTEPGVALRVESLLRSLAEEDADRQLCARIEDIRRKQSDVDMQKNRYTIEETLPDYRGAFQVYGWQANVTSGAEIAQRLAPKPPALQATFFAALDHWLILARHKKLAEADWLEQVLAEADPDGWRQRVRAARQQNDLAALVQLAQTCEVATQAPETLFILDKSLRQRGAVTTAAALLRRAQAAFPGDFWINHELGIVLQEVRPPAYEDAIRYLSVAVALRPDNFGVRSNLALALFKLGRYAEAAEAGREAVKRRPDFAVAQSNLGMILWENGRFDEAIDAFRKATAAPSPALCTHCSLGDALRCRGRLDEAAAAYRRAIAQKADYAEAHCYLGHVLCAQGKFAEALAELEHGHALGSPLKYWYLPSAEWLAQCKRLLELDRQGPAAFDLELPPASATARAEIAQLFQNKQRYETAALWWSSAFTADPELADNLGTGHRYIAARAAALAAAGDTPERVRWLRQALAWLQADLTVHRAQLTHGNKAERQRVRQQLRLWHSHPDLAILRDPVVLTDMCPTEQTACRQLWTDVAALLRQTAPGHPSSQACVPTSRRDCEIMIHI